MAGGFAGALIFISLLILLIILGFLILIHAAQGFFTTLEQTAGGAERVTWPDEPLIDQFGKPFYLVFLFGVFLAPVHLLTRVFVSGAGDRVKSAAPLTADFLALGLVVPVGLISVLSSTRWVPLRPAILGAMLRQPVGTFVYLVLNALVVGLLAAVVGGFLASGNPVVAFAAGRPW